MIDTGYFIKYISNRLHSFKEKNKEFYSVNLLNLNQIRSMLSDILQYSKSYDKINKKYIKKDKLLSIQNIILKWIHVIILHYCRNYVRYTTSYYKYESTELVERRVHELAGEKNELLSNIKLNSNEKYSKVSIFKGITIDISLKE